MKDSKALMVLFCASLLLNLLFIYVTKGGSQNAKNVPNTKETPNTEIIPIENKNFNLEEIYDLKNFKSSSYPTQHLERRLDRMYKGYLIDKKVSRNKRYTKEGKIERGWKRRCMITLRRISVINAHLGVLENTIKMSVGDNESAKQDLDMLIEQKQYRDKLMDMSNFYARYLTSYQYTYVQQTQD